MGKEGFGVFDVRMGFSSKKSPPPPGEKHSHRATPFFPGDSLLAALHGPYPGCGRPLAPPRVGGKRTLPSLRNCKKFQQVG